MHGPGVSCAPRRAPAWRRGLAIALVGLATVVSPAPSPAQPADDPAETVAPPLSADIIDIPPWGVRGPDGQAAGVYADLMQMLAARSQCPLQLRLVPILRSIQDVGRNLSHLTMMLDRQDMNAAGLALGSVTRLPVQIWLPAQAPARQLGELRGRTVAVLRGPTYHEGVQSDAAILKYPVSSPRQQLEMLRAGRVDAALGVEQNFLVAARQLGLGPQDFAPPLQLGARDVKLWIAPGLARHPCRERLAQALQALRQDGSIARRMNTAVGG